MKFALDFISTYLRDLTHLWSIFTVLLAVIAGLGLQIGKLERWNPVDSLYFAFTTASSVGYGDFVPTRPRSKLLAILIAFTGVLLVGLIVSVGLHALTHAALEARVSGVPAG